MENPLTPGQRQHPSNSGSFTKRRRYVQHSQEKELEEDNEKKLKLNSLLSKPDVKIKELEKLKKELKEVAEEYIFDLLKKSADPQGTLHTDKALEIAYFFNQYCKTKSLAVATKLLSLGKLVDDHGHSFDILKYDATGNHDQNLKVIDRLLNTIHLDVSKLRSQIESEKTKSNCIIS